MRRLLPGKKPQRTTAPLKPVTMVFCSSRYRMVIGRLARTEEAANTVKLLPKPDAMKL